MTVNGGISPFQISSNWSGNGTIARTTSFGANLLDRFDITRLFPLTATEEIILTRDRSSLGWHVAVAVAVRKLGLCWF